MTQAVDANGLDHLRHADYSMRLYSGGFNSLTSADPVTFQDLPFEVPEFSLVDGSGNPLSDEVASSIIYKKLQFPSITFATDERVWVSLAFGDHFGYAKKRWEHSLRDERDLEAVSNHLENHFFCATPRARFRDHAISRLWWIRRYIDRTILTEKHHAVEMFFGDGFADFPNNLLGRPNIAAIPNLASEIVEFAHDLFVVKGLKYDRNRVRAMLVNLDMAAGHQIPNLIGTEQIRKSLERAYAAPLLERLDGAQD